MVAKQLWGDASGRAAFGRLAVAAGLVLLGSGAAAAAPAACPPDTDAILRSVRQLRSSAAKKRIMDSLGDCISVAQIVAEAWQFRPGSVQSRTFIELAQRDLDENEAAAVLRGSEVLRSQRARLKVIVALIGKADREKLHRAAQTLPDPQLEEFLRRLVVPPGGD